MKSITCRELEASHWTSYGRCFKAVRINPFATLGMSYPSAYATGGLRKLPRRWKTPAEWPFWPRRRKDLLASA